MLSQKRITKRVVDGLKVEPSEYAVWDAQLSGFGVRVRPTGAKSYVVLYRAGTGRGAPQRRFTIGAVGKITPDKARERAKGILGAVAQGKDPAGEKTDERETPTVGALADRFMAEHVEPKLKPGTVNLYRDILNRIVKPEFGTTKANKLTRAAVAKLHGKLRATPVHANRTMTVLASMYSFASNTNIVPEGTIPVRKIDKYPEARRERFLTSEELERIGVAIREAETTGIPWEVDEDAPKAKHLVKSGNRFTKIGEHAAAALRLLLFTGARLREILHLKWENVDLERGLLFLADSKTGRKTLVLNAPAMAVLVSLPRVGSYVIASDTAGTKDEKPRADLKRPWQTIAKRTGLDGVRLHDLRHTYASFGAGGGLGLPIIGKLLGHTQASTTQRYAHLDNDPLRRATESIGSRIAAALDGKRGATVVAMNRAGR
jgi:integrase